MQNKIVILGKAGVGKTSLLKRYVDDQFHAERNPTNTAEFSEKSLYEGQIKLQFSDTAGDDKSHTFMPLYYRDAKVAIVAYDITNEDSFRAVDDYINNLYEDSQGVDFDNIILVGTKVDLHKNRQVSQKQLIEKANELNVHYFECSAKNDSNIKALFAHIVDLVVKKPEAHLVITNKPKDTINSIFDYIENTIKSDSESANPWGVGFWGSRYLHAERMNKRTLMPTSIKRIHDLCKKARERGTPSAYRRSLKKIARIVCRRELLVRDTFWNRIIRAIRRFLVRRKLILPQSLREEIFNPIYDTLNGNGFLSKKQIKCKGLQENVKKQSEKGRKAHLSKIQPSILGSDATFKNGRSIESSTKDFTGKWGGDNHQKQQDLTRDDRLDNEQPSIKIY